MQKCRQAVVWLLAWCALSACDAQGGSGAATAPPPASRFEAVVAKTAPVADPLLDFCDVRAEPGQGKLLHLPALEGVSPTQKPGALLWVNVWATWCKPCVEEMPMLSAWQSKLGAEGKNIALQFVSVDETAQAVTDFRTAHANVPPSQRITDPSALAAFVADLGLDAGAGLPIHIFADADSHVRCVRSGAVSDAHFAVVASMIK
jgi:thiol-disulfide isomerase/thioredoxin